MPPLVTTAEELLPLLSGKPLVLVDGVTGAGKSILARWLSESLHGVRISADDYVERLKGRDQRSMVFADLLDRVSLGAAIRAALPGPVVLDSICALDVARHLALRPDAHVLVTRTDPREARFDVEAGDYVSRADARVSEAALLDDRVTEEQILAWIKKRAPGRDFTNERSLATYFKRFMPHHVADAIYLRT